MSFDFMFRPPWPGGAVFTEASTDRIVRIDRRTGCFAVNNTALFAQTISVTMGVRIITPRLIPPFNFINIETDSTASGRTDAAALPGYARARVEARVRVLDMSMRVLAASGPNFFGGSAVDAPAFFGVGFPFSGTAFADASLMSSVGTAPLTVEVRITSWAVAYGWASATANILNGCITAIHVFSS